MRTNQNKKWTREKLIEIFQNVILPVAESLKLSYIRKYYRKFYLAMYKSEEIEWKELYALFNYDIELYKERTGEKYWTKERIIDTFQNEILPVADSLRPSYIRKHFSAFYSALNKSEEISWSELYALFGYDYDEIIKQPNVWTRNELINYMKDLIEKGEKVNLTSLSQNHEPFYKALMRSKEITLEELCTECGLDYGEIKRQKRYDDDKTARKKLIYLTQEGIPLHAKWIRPIDSALYNYLRNRGNGSLREGIKEVGFKATNIRNIPDIRIYDLNFLQLLGHRFQDVVSTLFKLIKMNIKDNVKEFNHCKPDFVNDQEVIWYDAKLTTHTVNEHIKKEKYHPIAEKVIYVYLEETEALISQLPPNVQVVNVDMFVNLIKNKTKKEYINGRLQEIKCLIGHSAIDNSLAKNSFEIRSGLAKVGAFE
jgi:hypothetical protein